MEMNDGYINLYTKIKQYQDKKGFSKLDNKEKYNLHKQVYEKLSKLEKGDYIEGIKFFEDI
jgi:hypothetical protein